jgi:hypothetical protein
MVKNKKSGQLSTQSGRTKIAQRFIAGNTARCSAPQSAKRTTETIPREGRLAVFLSPVSRALVLVLLLVPSTKVLGYFQNVRFADGNPIITMTAIQNKEIKPYELKVLAEGFHSSITDHPFVAVIRDKETYSALVNIEPSLPNLAEDFFQSHVVIAAFLGERNTGGYSVEITRHSTGRLLIGDKVPGKGMMVPQMITSPFKVVSVSVSGIPPLQQVGFSPAFVSPMRVYWARGKFEMTGGIAGVHEEFPLQGGVQVMREAGLATFWFTMPALGSAKERSFHEVATGVVQTSGRLVINRMSADLLVNQPNPGLKAIGGFTEEGESKLNLSFDSLPTVIADGYSGRGSIEAEIVKSRP